MKLSNITLVDVHKFFTQGPVRLEVLKGVDKSFDRGKTYAITGVSGTGKSTLMHIIAGLDVPSSGSVSYNNRDSVSFADKEKELLLNGQMGLVFQESYLIDQLNVLENIMLKGLVQGVSTNDLRKQALELLERIGLQDKADEYPPALSGGQQQRVALLRALFNKPSFLIADEPTGNLDLHTGKEIIDLLVQWCTQWSMGLIISSHDQYVAQSMQTVLLLRDGKFVSSDSQ